MPRPKKICLNPGRLYELQVKYELFLANTLAKRARYEVRYAIEDFRKKFPHIRHPEEVLRSDAETYRAHRARVVGPRTTNLSIRHLRAFWTWMIERDYATLNPFASVKLVPETYKHWDTFDPRYLLDLFSVAQTFEERGLLLLLITTLMTPSQLVALRWTDIDFVRGLLVLPPKAPKTEGGSLTIPLRSDVLELLRENQGPSEARVFAMWKGIRSVEYRFRDLQKLAGIPKLQTVRAFRQTAAVLLHRAGVDIRLVQQLLGYLSLTVLISRLPPEPVEHMTAALTRLPV